MGYSTDFRVAKKSICIHLIIHNNITFSILCINRNNNFKNQLISSLLHGVFNVKFWSRKNEQIIAKLMMKVSVNIHSSRITYFIKKRKRLTR